MSSQTGIIFGKVRWKNFLATGNHFIEVDLCASPTTLVLGENGAGKSTMLDALCFALFGKAFRNINKPQLTNSINEKDCLVECEFTIGNTEYLIRRGQKPGIFEIYQNGVLFNQDSTTRDYQKYLEQSILKLNYKSFTQIVVLGASNFTPFMQLTAADRRAVIEDLLDIQVFSNMNILLKQRIRDAESELAHYDSDIKILEEKVKLQTDHLNKIRERNQANLSSYKDEIETAEKNIAECNAQIEQTQREIEALQSHAESLETASVLFDKAESVQRKIKAKIGKVRDSIQFYDENDTCPTCTQAIDTDFKTRIVLEQKDRMGQLDEALDEVHRHLTEQGELVQKHQGLMKDLRTKENYVSHVHSDIRSNQAYIDKMNRKITEFENSDDDSTEIEERLTQFQGEKKTSEDKRKHVVEDQHYFKIAEGILKDTGIKSKIIRQYLPAMNKLINQYLQSLDFFVNFHLDENFKETVKSRHRDEFSYNSFSEGQKFRINIAILLAWRDIARMKNSTNTNLLILDEVFDSSLDSSGVDDFMQLLQLVSNDQTNVIVISHRGQTMIDKFDQVLEFTLRKNFTQMRVKEQA
jgi:DNA repair exonuclease SbcCD ATPase subunit